MPDEDFELWKKWDGGGRRKKDLLPLMDKFNPLVEKQVSVFKRVNIPEAAIRAKTQTFLVDAFQSFNPKQGVKLNTYCNWHMPKIKRFITTHQNFARIPEPMVYRISEFNMADRALTEKLNREPSVMEIADELKWPAKHVERMRKVLRKDLSADIYETDPTSLRESRWGEVKALIPYELTARENKVYETIFKSPKPMTTADVAKKLNMTPSQVNASKKKIGDTISKYMG